MTQSASSTGYPRRSDDVAATDARCGASGAARAAPPAARGRRSSRGRLAGGWLVGSLGTREAADEPAEPHERVEPPPDARAGSVTTTSAWPAVPRAHPAPGASGAVLAHSAQYA